MWNTTIKIIAPFFVLVLASLSMSKAIAQPNSTMQPKSQEYGHTAAEVNGSVISKDMVAFLGKSRESGLLSPETQNQDQLLSELITTELIYQAAINANTHQAPENKLELELAYKTLLSQLYVMEFMSQLSIDDQALEQAYRQLEAPAMVQMRHWSFDSETEARQFLQEVSQQSADSALGGTDEPWQRLSDYAFSSTLETKDLKTATWLPTPVPSVGNTLSEAAGSWQVWYCVSRSDLPKPELAHIRESLIQELAHEKLQQHLSALREQAKIVITANQGS